MTPHSLTWSAPGADGVLSSQPFIPTQTQLAPGAAGRLFRLALTPRRNR